MLKWYQMDMLRFFQSNCDTIDSGLFNWRPKSLDHETNQPPAIHQVLSHMGLKRVEHVLDVLPFGRSALSNINDNGYFFWGTWVVCRCTTFATWLSQLRQSTGPVYSWHPLAPGAAGILAQSVPGVVTSLPVPEGPENLRRQPCLLPPDACWILLLVWWYQWNSSCFGPAVLS